MKWGRNGKTFSVERLEDEARARMSLLVEELRAAHDWIANTV
jgi:hypothetical protein